MKKHILLSLLPLIILPILLITTTSCGTNPKTINPFYSSFEDNDPTPLSNETFGTSINLVSPPSIDVTTGPTEGYGTKTENSQGEDIGYGYTGLHSLQYAAEYDQSNQDTSFGLYVYKDLNIIVGTNTEFSYKIFPYFADSSDDDLLHNLNYISTYVSLDLLYNDNNSSTKLRSLGATGIKDVNGFGLSPEEQGNSKCLFSYQWNLIKVELAQLSGIHIHSIILKYHMTSPANVSGDHNTVHNIQGFIDDIFIGDKKIIDPSSLTNYVDTRRGTDGHMDWSRGSNFPGSCLPHGFNFYAPLQHARLDSSGDADWLYNYKKFNNDDNLPTLNGFAISHEPAPWMHDYDQMQIMPQLGDSTIDVTTEGRRIAYQHDNEIAQPDYYRVVFENGIKTELTPSSHSTIMRFTFPNHNGRIIFDSLLRSSRCSDKFVFQNNIFSGYVDNGAWSSAYQTNYHGGQTRMFFYGMFSSSNFAHRTAVGDNGVLRPYCDFTLDNNKTIELKLSTSFLSVNQAKHNLELEVLNDRLDFDSLHKRATKIWNKQLSVIDLSYSNATDEQKKRVYSDLYRINMYPNASFENINTNEQPIYKHVSSVLPTIGAATDTITNAQIFEGKTYVNNGFWDTYRTLWPIYSILYPNFLHEMIDGFLYQYLENGFVSRWSAPGDTDCMTGTSSNCAFANAYINDSVTDINTVINIYNSGIADAFRYTSDLDVGRKGIEHSMFRGWTADTDVANGENMIDWDFQGWINDYALGQMALKLSQDHNLTESLAQSQIGQSKQQIHDTGEYLLKRANNYTNLFWTPPSEDEEKGFFRSKTSDGSWYVHDHSHNAPDTTPMYPDYDPREWGYEYVEANGWNFAFTPVYDIEGLIDLYGGQNNLIEKLDEFFNTPETGQYMGSIPWGVYSFTRETRDLRFGQCVISNQPSHHIPYMYAEAGVPWKTQNLTRQMLKRMFVGSDIGQGYSGDEDNGEMSSWYMLSAMGLYDLVLGKDQYVITSPLFDWMRINRDNGSHITIVTNDTSGNNNYIKSAKLDGYAINDVHLQASSLLKGNHTISYKMSKQPTNWACKEINGKHPDALQDVALGNTFTTTDTITNLDNLTDGDATTQTLFNGTNTTINWNNANENQISMFGITSGDAPLSFNNVTIKASNNQSSWITLTSVQSVIIRNEYETKVFSINSNQTYTYYQVIFNSPIASLSLGEFQFLAII